MLILFQVDPSKNVSLLGKISYDAINERIRFIEDVDISGKRSFFDNIILFREVLTKTFGLGGGCGEGSLLR